MSRKPFQLTALRRDILLLFGLALVVRFLTALPQQQPNYMDAAYSYVNALNLVAGRGFVEDFVWNYLDNPSPPPHPSHLYWMPLTSILAGLGMAIGGVTYRAAQMPFVVVSALLASISYWATYALVGQRWQSWIAGLLAIFSGFYFPFWPAIDNFTPFAVTGSLALLMVWRGMGGQEAVNNESQPAAPKGYSSFSAPHLIAAGLFMGLAHLARADGPLLLIAVLLVYLFHATPRPFSAFISQGLRFGLPLLLGYALVMAPWFIRNWLVAGTPLPTAGSQTIWLATVDSLPRSYGNLYSYGRELSARTFFAQDIGLLLQGRWWVLTTNLQTVFAVWGMIFLVPLLVVGAWQMRRRLLMQLALCYGVLLFLALTFVFAFPGAMGGLFHSGGALLPFICAAAVIGLDDSVDWIAARRRHWDADLAKRVFGVGLVIIALALSSFIYYGRVLKNNVWNKADAHYPTVAVWVAQANPGATVMINNPPAYIYHGGGLTVSVPYEDLETTLQVAQKYGVTYLILGTNHPEPLADLYDQTLTHPHLPLVKSFGKIHIFEVIE